MKANQNKTEQVNNHSLKKHNAFVAEAFHLGRIGYTV